MVHRWQGGDGGFLWVSRVYYSFHLSLFESSPVPPPDPSQLLANLTNTSHIPLLSSCNLSPYAWFCITLMFNHHYTHCVCMSPCFSTKILLLPAKWGHFFKVVPFWPVAQPPRAVWGLRQGFKIEIGIVIKLGLGGMVRVWRLGYVFCLWKSPHKCEGVCALTNLLHTQLNKQYVLHVLCPQTSPQYDSALS